MYEFNKAVIKNKEVITPALDLFQRVMNKDNPLSKALQILLNIDIKENSVEEIGDEECLIFDESISVNKVKFTDVKKQYEILIPRRLGIYKPSNLGDFFNQIYTRIETILDEITNSTVEQVFNYLSNCFNILFNDRVVMKELTKNDKSAITVTYLNTLLTDYNLLIKSNLDYIDTLEELLTTATNINRETVALKEKIEDALSVVKSVLDNAAAATDAAAIAATASVTAINLIYPSATVNNIVKHLVKLIIARADDIQDSFSLLEINVIKKNTDEFTRLLGEFNTLIENFNVLLKAAAAYAPNGTASGSKGLPTDVDGVKLNTIKGDIDALVTTYDTLVIPAISPFTTSINKNDTAGKLFNTNKKKLQTPTTTPPPPPPSYNHIKITDSISDIGRINKMLGENFPIGIPQSKFYNRDSGDYKDDLKKLIDDMRWSYR